MALSEKLFEILACPKCLGELSYNKDRDNLSCGSCDLEFRVEDNVPVLCLDEAERIG